MDKQMENCDVCNAPMPGDALLEHFRTEHPKEWKERCERPVKQKDSDPTSLCGCGVVHRRSERCGPW